MDSVDSGLGSSLLAQSTDVNLRLASTIEQLETQLTKIREDIVQWEAVEKLKVDLGNWLDAKNTELQQMKEKPAKLHVEAAELELSHLEVILT